MNQFRFSSLCQPLLSGNTYTFGYCTHHSLPFRSSPPTHSSRRHFFSPFSAFPPKVQSDSGFDGNLKQRRSTGGKTLREEEELDFTRMTKCTLPPVVLPVEDSDDDFVTQPIQIKRAEVCTGGEKIRTQGGEVRGSKPEVQRRLREDVEVDEVQGERGVEPVGVVGGRSKGKRSRIGETKKGWVSGGQSEGNKSAGVQNLGVEGSGRGEVEAEQSVDVKEVETEYVGGWEVQAEESVIMEEVQTGGVGGSDVQAESVGDRKVKRRGRPRTIIGSVFAGETIKTRNSPVLLRNTIMCLNDIQKTELKDIGFGDCLYLNVSEIPSKFGRWLVDSFDADRCTLGVDQGLVKITRKRVSKILGIPMGNEKIVLPPRLDSSNEMVKRWRLELGLSKGTVIPRDVSEEVLKHHGGGGWFKVQFLLLFSTIMIKSNGNGTCNLKILQIMDDITKVKDYDWCGFLIETLKSSKKEWEKSKNSAYTGPLTFLALFYCEMCDAKEYFTERTKPVLKGWDTTKLRARVYHEMKMGGFGLGKVRRKYRKGMKKMKVEKKPCAALGAESSMLKGKKLAKCINKVKVNACAKDHGVEAAEISKMREIKNKNGKKNRKVDFSGEEPAKSAKGKADKPNKRGKKRKHSSCAENPEESLKMKAKSKTLYEDDEEMEVVDLSPDADTSMMGSLIRGNSELHIPFEGIESRRQAMKEQGWERAVVEDGDSEIQEVQEYDGGSEDLHDRSTEGVQAPSFDKVGVVQPGGDVQSVEVEVEEIACNQGQIKGQDEKDSCEPHYQDTDTGGVDLQLKFMTCSGRSTYAVVIDNLEKDLTPLTATNFILKETNINCQAYIFPSMLTDKYTRGIIEVNSREEFIEFNNFLESTHQIIVSSHSRPWVMAGQQGEVRTIMPTSGGQQIHSARSLGELKVVRSGTPEYNIAKQLKENFIEFCSHGKRVLERLAWEEQRIKSRWAIN